MHKLIKHCLLTSVAAMALVSTASPAQAASESCFTFGRTCHTSPVAASRNHHVHIFVDSWIRWEVVDVANGVWVASGKSGTWGTRRTITGLYSRYRLQLHGGFSWGTIRND